MADIRTTPQLDDFVRANENPLSGGGNWAQVDSTLFPTQLQNLSNLAQGQGTGGTQFATSYWVPTNFDGDMEVWAVVSGFLDFTNAWYLALFHSPGGAGVIDGYRIGWINNIGDDSVQVRRMDNSTGAVIATASPITTPAAGDLILFRTVGNDLQGWISFDAGANWTQQVTVTDATYRTDLHLGLANSSSTAQPTFQGFGGGVAGAVTRKLLPFLHVGP